MILFLTFLAFATGCLLGARAVRPCPASQPHRHEWAAFCQGGLPLPPVPASSFGSLPVWAALAGTVQGPGRAASALATSGGRIYLQSRA